MAFYKEFTEIKIKLEQLGHSVLAPDLEFETKGDHTSVGTYFDTHGGVDAFPVNHDVWKKKGSAMTTHFRKIDESDAILITNYEKKVIPNYIGGNTFLEMGYAFATNKKIFILNELPTTSFYKEELLGLQPIVLHSDISQITQ